MVLVTILARSGSKRLPGKHSRDFCGRPLLDWTLAQAVEWTKKNGAYGVIYTDIYLEKEFKACLPDNWYTMQRVHEEQEPPKLQSIRKCLGGMHTSQFDTIIDLDATNPLRTQQMIDEAYEIFKHTQPPSLVSVVPARRLPWYNQVFNWEYAGPRICFNESDVDAKLYDLNANINIYSRKFLLSEANHPVTSESMLYEMPRWTAIDIDYEWELIAAESLFKEYVLGQETGVDVDVMMAQERGG